MPDSAGAITAKSVVPMPVRAAAALQPIRLPDWLATALAYLGIALITRAFLFGNDVIHVDEEFYLFVADRMAHGALPYVDIWDRKPIGLFLLYSGLSSLPGDSVLAYQVGAIASLVATSMVISRLAREIASATAAWQAGVAYMLFMPMFNCGMGQAPVFYNLLVALAALGIVETVKRAEEDALLWRGAGIMLVVGLAIQIKYTVIFEGICFGMLLLGRAFADVWSWKRLSGAAALWILAALTPTLLALAAYAAMGHAEAFLYANFVSVFERNSDGWTSYWRLIKETAALLPFWLAIFHAPRLFAPTDGTSPRSHAVLKVWGISACAGFLLFGTWYDHYVGPLLVPLSVLAAPALGRLIPKERRYGQFMMALGTVGAFTVPAYQVWRHGTAEGVAEMTAIIRQEMRGGCLFMYEGEPVFYRTTNSCLPTTRIFPNHLNTWIEAPALGIDATEEIRRVLASKPDVITIWAPRKLYLPNYQTRRLVQNVLARDYERYATYTLGTREYYFFRPRRTNPDI